MKVQTKTGHYPELSTDKLYQFIANADNLPKWATMFCKSIQRNENAYYTVITTENIELLFKIEDDITTGIIDMYMGTDKEMMWKIPARVISDNMSGSIFTFTLIQMQNQTNDEFEKSCQSVDEELKMIQSVLN